MTSVKRLEEVFPADVRKAVVKVTSTFTEPIDVSVRLDQPDNFFMNVEPSRFRLQPGESRLVEIYLYPMLPWFTGVEKQVRLIFSTSTYVTTESTEALLIMMFKRIRSAFDVDGAFTLGSGLLAFVLVNPIFQLSAGIQLGFEVNPIFQLSAGIQLGFEVDITQGLGGGIVGSVT